MRKEDLLENITKFLRQNKLVSDDRLKSVSSRMLYIIINSNPKILMEEVRSSNDYVEYHTWPC